jgi:hypothetical protein
MQSSEDRAAFQAGVDVKVMLTVRLAEALGVDDSILDFDDLVERVRALAVPPPAVDRAALIALLLNGLNGELSEEGMGDAFWHIEGNYQREGSGPGSPFEGMMLTTVQAHWARSHLIEAAVDCLIAAGVVCGRGAS